LFQFTFDRIETMKKKVLIGMSGGVDSSVAAYLLKKQGYDVIGVTMQIWDEVSEESGTCCSLSAVEDARRVASKLGIPHYVFNFKNSFDKEVVQYFISEYLKGRTPNPCIACNKHIKFDELLKKANSMDIEYVSTGHYAQIVEPSKKTNNRYLLKKGKDPSKDQSYVLYNLTQEQLSKSLFPLGKLKKKKVRKIAEKIGLAVANKKDSQEICFVTDNNYGKFIEDQTKKDFKEGNIIDLQGNILGQHNGIHKYTVGQRKGIKTLSNEPLYVIKIDTTNNQLVVGKEEDIYTHKLIAGNLNWISIENLQEPMKVRAKIRYRSEDATCTISNTGRDHGEVIVEFEKRQRAITPGQSVVFYDKDLVVGGGIIQE
jgi:tRNA-uridine 2-sulfurtransferase